MKKQTGYVTSDKKFFTNLRDAAEHELIIKIIQRNVRFWRLLLVRAQKHVALPAVVVQTRLPVVARLQCAGRQSQSISVRAPRQ